MKRTSLLITTSLIGLMSVSSGLAQTTDVQTGHNTWQDQQINELTNIRYGELSPTFLSHNKKSTSAFAKVNYNLARGKYHAPDQSGRENDLNVYFGGLKRIGKLDLSGYLKYVNQQADNQRWNSSLYLNPDNPFVLADSVLSDVTAESFHMNAAASYQFLPALEAGLSIGLKTGSRSDQNDPRPKTNSSVVPITAGIEWTPSKAWSFGLAGNIELYRPDINYTLINNLIVYRYFVMKGMGDYYGVSTGSQTSYDRDYKGTSWQAAVHGVWQPQGQWSDFLELRIAGNNQKATDGGSSYTFKGGEYKYTQWSLLNRLQYRPSDRVLHQLAIEASYKSGNSTWSDQTRRVDTEHANRIYYEVLSTYKVQKSKRLQGDLTYRFDRFKADKPDLYATVNVGAVFNSDKHYTDAGWPKQKYTLAHVNLNAGKSWALGNNTLTTSLGGGYYFTLGDKTFGSGNTSASALDITSAYVLPYYEYITGKHFNVGGQIDFNAPLKSKSGNLSLGGFVKVWNNLYADNGEFSAKYKSKAFTNIDLGLYLTF